MRIFILISALFLISCNKHIKPEKGSVDILSNIYYDASKGLDKQQFYHVSQLNFKNDTILEMIPDIENPLKINSVNLIVDTVYFKMGSYEQAKRTLISSALKTKAYSVYNKPLGAVYTKQPIPLYSERKEMSDTVLFKRPYKRFRIEDKKTFSIYYVYPTDTIYPYSLNRKIEEDYKGRLERIDSYSKDRDIFVSMQFVNSTKLDDKAKDIFYKFK